MNPVVSADIHFYLVLPLVFLFLKGLDTVSEYCPISCYCTSEVLNCSRVGNSPGLQHVPFSKPVAHPHTFFSLVFTGNDISSIGKQVWKAYPWAEHLVLKGNSLSRVQNSSLEGLLSLTHLDLSCNKIKIIQRNAFEAVPFLQFINFSGNVLEHISPGTFEAWHRMRFLLKLDLTHNPLIAIEDDHFYRLPSLKFLDLSATESTPKVVANILQTSLQLKTLILPNKMSCCLCYFKDDIEILNIIKLDCTNACTRRIKMCEEEESVHNLQEILMKVLQIRKKHASSILRIMPKIQPQRKNMTLKPVVSMSHTNVDHLLPTLWKSGKELKKLKADMLLLRDKSELTKLDMLANLLQMALKEKIAKAESNKQEAKVQHETSAQASVIVAPENAKFKKRRHLNKVKRDVRLRKKEHGKETFLRFVRIRRESARAMMHHAEQPNRMHSRIQQLMKLVDDQDLQSAASLFRNQEIPKVHPEHSVMSHLPSIMPPLTASVIVDDKPAHLTGQVIIVVNRRNRTKTGHTPGEMLTENREGIATLSSTHNPSHSNEENLEKVPEKKGDYRPVMKKLFKLLRHWKHSSKSSDIFKLLANNSELETTTVHSEILPMEDDYFLQGDVFEATVNEKLKTVITNEPMRSLISHVLRILKMDCITPKIQMTCAKLLSRTGVLIKLFSKQENNKGLPKSYFLSTKNITNMTKTGPQKPEIIGQEIEYGYGSKLLLAVSVTGVIIITIAIICLIEICTQRSAKKEGTVEENRPLFRKASESTLFGKPLKSAEKISAPGKQISFKESEDQMTEVPIQSIEGDWQDDEASQDEEIYSWTRPLSPSVIGKTPSRKSMSIIMAPGSIPPSPGPPSIHPSETYNSIAKHESSGGERMSSGGKSSRRERMSSRGTSSGGERASSRGGSRRERESSRGGSSGEKASSRGGSSGERASSRGGSSGGGRASSRGGSSGERASSRGGSSGGGRASSRGGSSGGERASSRGGSSGAEEMSSRAASSGEERSSERMSSGGGTSAED